MKTKSLFFLPGFWAGSFLLIISLLFFSCDPQRQALLRETKPQTLPEQVTGAYAVVQPLDPKAKKVKGELIAANDQRITLLTDTGLREMPLANCDSIEFYISKDVNHRGALTAWAVILPFTTFIHGYFLIVTFPLNLLITIPTLCSIHGYYITSYPDHLGKQEIAKFARFPQGLPEGISYHSLK